MLNLLSSPSTLRAVIWFDAFTGVLLGALHLLFTASLSERLGLPANLVTSSGVMLLCYAALAITLVRAPSMPRAGVRVLIVGNVAWAFASLALLLSSAVTPSLLGQGYLLMHVVSVAMLAELQWMGARRLPGFAAV